MAPASGALSSAVRPRFSVEVVSVPWPIPTYWSEARGSPLQMAGVVATSFYKSVVVSESALSLSLRAARSAQALGRILRVLLAFPGLVASAAVLAGGSDASVVVESFQRTGLDYTLVVSTLAGSESDPYMQG